MDSGIAFYAVGVLVVLLVLASWLERKRDKNSSKLLLLIALAIVVGALISWALGAITYTELS